MTHKARVGVTRSAGGRESGPRGPYTLICLGGIAWGNAWKRNQSMVYELAAWPLFDRVIFVNPKEMWLRDELFKGEGTLGARVQRILDSLPRDRGRNITTLSFLRCLPFKNRIGWVERLEGRVFHLLLKFLRGHRPYVLLNNHPAFYWKGLLETLIAEADLSVYDLSDDFPEFHQVPRHRKIITESVRFCCRESDLVLAVNDHVADRYRPYNENCHVVLNATNVDNFQRDHYRAVPMLERLRDRSSALICYAGIINKVRLDYELIRHTLQARPSWHFVFLGHADPSFLQLVSEHPNLHHHPPVDYRNLPDWIHGMDAVAVPFEYNAHTQGNDLLKINDALAMGMPVVVAGVRGLDRYGDLLREANGLQDFVQALEEAIDEDDPALAKRRREYARKNSWEHRTRRVQSLLREALLEKEGARARV